MRQSLAVPAMLVCAIALGGLLYLFGGPDFSSPLTQSPGVRSSGTPFETIAAGTNAVGQDRRANYRIKSAEELATLWEMIYSNNGPSVPVIDFSREEVIAVFDGSHSTSGYDIRVTDVKDGNGVRTVAIERTVPGDACAVTSGIESPFHIVRAQKSSLPLAKQETTVTDLCR